MVAPGETVLAVAFIGGKFRVSVKRIKCPLTIGKKCIGIFNIRVGIDDIFVEYDCVCAVKGQKTEIACAEKQLSGNRKVGVCALISIRAIEIYDIKRCKIIESAFGSKRCRGRHIRHDDII